MIRHLAGAGYVVIACGGGGIPVIEDARRRPRGRRGGDRQGPRLEPARAQTSAPKLLVLPTGVEKVAIDFNKPTQRWLDRMTLAEARRYTAEDQFDKGSMGPKYRR